MTEASFKVSEQREQGGGGLRGDGGAEGHLKSWSEKRGGGVNGGAKQAQV